MSRRMKWIVGLGLPCLVAVASCIWLAPRVGPVGSGFVAKYLCSSTFISKRKPARVFQEDIVPVNPLARFFGYRIDRKKKTVSADVHGWFASTAIYREGCGCSLVVGTTAEEMRRQPLVDPGMAGMRPPLPEERPWPDGRAGPSAAALRNVDRPKLAQALDWAFAEPNPTHPRKTRAVVIIYDGRLVAERYAPGFGPDMPLLGWSMSKSVTNALVGILVQQGQLDIRLPAAVPEWRGAQDPRQAITLDQLLRMSSGLAFAEVYKPLYDATEMLYRSYDFAAFAAAKPLEAAPDTKWSYSSGSANIVARIVRQTASQRYPYYYRFIDEALFQKIGMTSAVMEPDASGTIVGSSYCWATPRDWARFGQFYLQDGVWRGVRILPAGWVAYSTAPTPAAPQGEYGALFWLNAGAADNPANRRYPHAPVDTFEASGFQEQKVIVIPSRKAVLVRLGATSDRRAWNTDEFIRLTLAALPEGRP